MRITRLCLGLLCSTAFAQSQPFGGTDPRAPNSSAFAQGQPFGGTDPRAVLRVLPGGYGSPPVGDLCSYMGGNGMLTGNYTCMRGDATQLNSGAALVAVGSPVAGTLRQCPNGPNCGAVNVQKLSAGNYFSGGPTATPANDFSVGALFRTTDTNSAQVLLGQDDGSTHRIWEMEISSGALFVNLFSGNSTFTQAGSVPGVVVGAVHLYVATYHFVADGSSVLVGYLDGVSVTTTSTVHGPPNPVTRLTEMAQAGAAPPTGQMLGAFKTDVALTPAQVTALANLTLGAGGPAGLSGSFGEPMTYSLPTARSYAADDGSIGMVPAGRPVITQGGIDTPPPATNLILQGGNLANASWPLYNGTAVCALPVVTGSSTDIGYAPDGLTYPAKVVFPACSGTGNNSILYQAYNATAAGYSHSVSARTASGTYAFNVATTLGAVLGGTVVCTANSTGWTRCCLPNITETAVAWTLSIGHQGLAAGDAAIAAGTVYLDFGQAELGQACTPYIPTTTIPVARGLSVAAMASAPPGLPTTVGCVAMDVIPLELNQSPNFYDTSTIGQEGIWLQLIGPNLYCRLTHSAVIYNAIAATPSWNVGERIRIRADWDSTGLTCTITTPSGSAVGVNNSLQVPTSNAQAPRIGSASNGAAGGVVANLVTGTSRSACP